MRVVFYSKCSRRPRADRMRAVNAWAEQRGHEVVAVARGGPKNHKNVLVLQATAISFELLGFCAAHAAEALVVWRLTDLFRTPSGAGLVWGLLRINGLPVLHIQELEPSLRRVLPKHATAAHCWQLSSHAQRCLLPQKVLQPQS